jgi:tRNA 2-thiocytidine biosynthesis protein TtcA
MRDRVSREHQIRRLTGQAIGKFGLIAEGDRILVALSGGKDSWTLLTMLENLRRRAPVDFSLTVVTVHPGFPGFRTEGIESYLRKQGYDYRIVNAPVQIFARKARARRYPLPLCARINAAKHTRHHSGPR